MEVDPNTLAIADRYKLLIGAIVPRPIALVSTCSENGSSNLAPFSFFSAIGSNPMTLLFCPSNKPDGSEKDTLRNAKPKSEGGQGEFVINLARESYARAVATAAEELPYENSEFDLCGLNQMASKLVKPPRVAESPVAFECQTRQIIRLNPGAKGGGNIIIGDVVWVHIDEAVLTDRMRIDPTQLGLVGRMGGLTFCRTQDRFDLPMGKEALTAHHTP